MIREDLVQRSTTRLKTRARCYIRVSRVGNRELLSDAAQLAGAESYCERVNWKLDVEASKECTDLDTSGYSKSWKRRNGLKRLVEDAKKGLYDHLIVYRLDRLGRNLADSIECFALLASYGVEVRTLEGDMDPSTPMGAYMINNLLNNAQLEAANTSERARYMVNYRASTGRWHGGQLPNWLMHDPDVPKKRGEQRPVIVNQPVADAVLRMVELRLQGYGLGEITSIVNKEKFLPPRGGAWHYANVRKYLRPDYVDSMLGFAFIHRPERRRTNALTGRTEEYEGGPQKVGKLWPTIIDEPTAEQLKAIYWDTTRRHTEEVKVKTRERKSDNILSGVMRCAECGERYIGTRYPAKRVRCTRAYKCYSQMGKKGLDVKHTRVHVAADLIEDAVLRVVRHALERVPQVEQAKSRPKRTRRPEARGLEEINADIDAVMSRLDRGIIQEADFERRYRVLVTERERFTSQQDQPEIDLEAALAVVNQDEITPANLRLIVRALVDRVEYPAYLPGLVTTCNRVGGTDHNPRPCARVILKYQVEGVTEFFAPIYMNPRSKTERVVLPIISPSHAE